MASQLFQTKPLHLLQGEGTHSGLKRVLGPLDLTLLGIGAIIGTGIFVLTGTAAVGHIEGGEIIRAGAGPGIVLSFIIVGVVCALAALCYAEFASMIPIAGSAYTYAYASFGELAAWIIGWDLILEYAVGNIAVAIGWSGYFKDFLEFFGAHFPAWLAIDPMTAANAVANPAAYSEAIVGVANEAYASAPNLGFPFIMNLPALLVTFLVTGLLVYGVKESARLNSALVFLKLGLVALFLFIGLQHVDFAANWAGLNEAGASKFAPYGLRGIMTGAGIIFFAYIGFDAVSTTAEEARNPQKDLPIGMLASLVICTILYIAVAAVLTGMVPLSTLNNAHPVAAALRSVGSDGAATVISLGASMAIVSVLLVMQYAQTRIFFSMSRDGLLPRLFSKVSPRFGTPAISTIVTGLIVGIPAAFIDIAVAAELSNIGTLFAFALVAGGIMILRVREPGRHRGFRVPAVWVVAPATVISCLILMGTLTKVTWERFGIWLALGLLIYFLYSKRNSNLAQGLPPAPVTPDEPQTLSPADKVIDVAGEDREV